ncbi:hypothetical protein [Virgibacillus alimentarius]|uniref:RNA polymerase subunit sigma-70 n=1 Tax=Virgibacillus alimentarius TaxID=698769 RepID=A0ABS4S6B8_9BACI|nr:hypothetical protein [Virgibacillus alimentarius]MBP2256606.1 hypothetical protein [Virgibacillus alimentarius]
MRIHDKQWQSTINKSINDVNFHRFIEMDGKYNAMEVAQELGISLREVKMLKKKITRT